MNKTYKYQLPATASGTNISSSMGPWDKQETNIYPGLEVVLAHKLSPNTMQLNFGGDWNDDIDSVKYNPAKGLSYNHDKFNFYYTYLDLNFGINTNDDVIAAKLFPFFTDKQKTEIMALTLGARE